MGCVYCHGGVEPAEDKYEAHEGITVDPSEGSGAVCAQCHPEIVSTYATSFHAQLLGEHTMIAARSGDDDWESDPVMMEGFEGSCNGCHASCGQCHVSRPDSVAGGLINGHAFDRTPSMINQCTACHGSRVGEEFRGTHRDEIPGYQADVHYLASMRCEACHGAEEMHGATGEHRYAAELMPRCEDCHEGVEASNAYHSTHWGELSCQVCHAQDYKHCASCHAPDGLDEPSELGFEIGLNPLPENRPYRYVTLRHIPIVPDTYAGWGVKEDLAEYAALPSYKYTTPHNIQRWTSRTTPESGENCATNCHETFGTDEDCFFRQSDLDRFPHEADANRAYIVPDGNPVDWEDRSASIPPPAS
jgi:hypothetical protein